MFKKVLYEYKKRNAIKGSEAGDNYKIVKTSFIVDTTQFIICLKSQKNKSFNEKHTLETLLIRSY